MNSKNLLVLVAVLLIAAFALWGLLSTKSTYQPETEVSLDSELNSLDSTDLDSEFDSQMNQLTSDSFSF